jgi:hypothetical protein
MAELKDYPGYFISKTGHVWNNITRHWVSQHLDDEGYPRVNLWDGEKNHSKTVHALLMLTFIGTKPVGTECCHNNGNPKDNRLENLRYDTHSANLADAGKQGRLGMHGEEHHQAKLTNADVTTIRLRYANRKKGDVRKMALEYGVERHAITKVGQGRMWRHI